MVSRVTRALIPIVIVVAAANTTTRGQSRPSAAAPSATFDPTEKSIEQLQRAMESGQVTSRQLVDVYLARIAEYDQQGPALNAIKAVNPRAREAADALDAERVSRSTRGPLHGIPVVVK